MNAQHTALTPAQGHIGFEGPLLRGFLPVGDYFHYLHHQFIDCNFGTPTIAWDKWLGKYFNGQGPFRKPKPAAQG
jgi:sterol desaturase/sphingolipid hydroxylase (fatty acid hydroxylase superfamily)